jgi:hypothetical protein
MTKFKVALPILAVAMAGAMLVQSATATHPRPNSATPLYVPLVVAYKACTAPNSNHNGGVSARSCTAPVGPVQESSFLTVGTPDANGAGASMSGFVKLVVKTTSPEDVLVTSHETDVRCKPATNAGVCNSPNAADGPDYSGQLQGIAQIRITDHFNGTSGTDTGTVIDLPLPVNTYCGNTASTNVGAACTSTTSVGALIPGSVPDGKRMNVEIQAMNIFDGGASGYAQAPDATRFATQGIFIP